MITFSTCHILIGCIEEVQFFLATGHLPFTSVETFITCRLSWPICSSEHDKLINVARSVLADEEGSQESLNCPIVHEYVCDTRVTPGRRPQKVLAHISTRIPITQPSSSFGAPVAPTQAAPGPLSGRRSGGGEGRLLLQKSSIGQSVEVEPKSEIQHINIIMCLHRSLSATLNTLQVSLSETILYVHLS